MSIHSLITPGKNIIKLEKTSIRRPLIHLGANISNDTTFREIFSVNTGTSLLVVYKSGDMKTNPYPYLLNNRVLSYCSDFSNILFKCNIKAEIWYGYASNFVDLTPIPGNKLLAFNYYDLTKEAKVLLKLSLGIDIK